MGHSWDWDAAKDSHSQGARGEIGGGKVSPEGLPQPPFLHFALHLSWILGSAVSVLAVRTLSCGTTLNVTKDLEKQHTVELLTDKCCKGFSFVK